MSKLMWLLVGLAVVAFFAVSSAISSSNNFARLDETVNATWGEVQNQYQRRTDLIPNLVNTVKGVANFEQKTLTDVIEARANATKVTLNADQLTDPEAVKKFEQAQGAVSSTLGRLMVVSENYPNLKANQNFIDLQSQLEGTENRISVARRDYIAAVQQYNTSVRLFPGSFWASFKGLKPKQSFTAVEGADKPPTVQF